jgi:hypothetical protein
MPQHQDHLRDGATSARSGEPANQPHPEARYQQAAERMGVPRQWVENPFHNTVGFAGRVKGRVGDQLMVDASSTGGGKTDTHMIHFPTGHLSDAGFQKHFVDSGTKFRFHGEHDPKQGVQWRGADIVRD